MNKKIVIGCIGIVFMLVAITAVSAINNKTLEKEEMKEEKDCIFRARLTVSCVVEQVLVPWGGIPVQLKQNANYIGQKRTGILGGCQWFVEPGKYTVTVAGGEHEQTKGVNVQKGEINSVSFIIDGDYRPGSVIKNFDFSFLQMLKSFFQRHSI